MPQAKPATGSTMTPQSPWVAMSVAAAIAHISPTKSATRGRRRARAQVISMTNTVQVAWSTVAVPALVRATDTA